LPRCAGIQEVLRRRPQAHGGRDQEHRENLGTASQVRRRGCSVSDRTSQIERSPSTSSHRSISDALSGTFYLRRFIWDTLPSSVEQVRMKIRHIEALAVSLPMVKPLKMSFEEVRSGENVLVRLEVDDGTVGWGGAASAPTMTGETVARMAAASPLPPPRPVGLAPAGIGRREGPPH